jgi:hypothetical protein
MEYNFEGIFIVRKITTVNAAQFMRNILTQDNFFL